MAITDKVSPVYQAAFGSNQNLKPLPLEDLSYPTATSTATAKPEVTPSPKPTAPKQSGGTLSELYSAGRFRDAYSEAQRQGLTTNQTAALLGIDPSVVKQYAIDIGAPQLTGPKQPDRPARQTPAPAPARPLTKRDLSDIYDVPDVRSFDPVTGEVDPETSTVEGRLPGLLASEGKYISDARQRGIELANRRGLLNTSIAAAAAEREGIRAALPIAQQDATTYTDQDRLNQEIAAQVQAAEQGQTYEIQGQRQAALYDRAGTTSQQSHEMGLLEAEAAAKERLQRQAEEARLGEMERESELRRETMEVEAGIKERLAAVEQQYAVDLETLAQEYSIQQNRDTQMGNMYSDALKSIATFLDDPKMSEEQQTNGINLIISNLESGLKFLSGVTEEPGTMTEEEAGQFAEEAVPGGPSQEELDAEAAAEEDAELREQYQVFAQEYEASTGGSPYPLSFEAWKAQR